MRLMQCRFGNAANLPMIDAAEQKRRLARLSHLSPEPNHSWKAAASKELYFSAK
jgi:hypothetical protein